MVMLYAIVFLTRLPNSGSRKTERPVMSKSTTPSPDRVEDYVAVVAHGALVILSASVFARFIFGSSSNSAPDIAIPPYNPSRDILMDEDPYDTLKVIASVLVILAFVTALFFVLQSVVH